MEDLEINAKLYKKIGSELWRLHSELQVAQEEISDLLDKAALDDLGTGSTIWLQRLDKITQTVQCLAGVMCETDSDPAQIMDLERLQKFVHLRDVALRLTTDNKSEEDIDARLSGAVTSAGDADLWI